MEVSPPCLSFPVSVSVSAGAADDTTAGSGGAVFSPAANSPHAPVTLRVQNRAERLFCLFKMRVTRPDLFLVPLAQGLLSPADAQSAAGADGAGIELPIQMKTRGRPLPDSPPNAAHTDWRALLLQQQTEAGTDTSAAGAEPKFQVRWAHVSTEAVVAVGARLTAGNGGGGATGDEGRTVKALWQALAMRDRGEADEELQAAFAGATVQSVVVPAEFVFEVVEEEEEEATGALEAEQGVGGVTRKAFLDRPVADLTPEVAYLMERALDKRLLRTEEEEEELRILRQGVTTDQWDHWMQAVLDQMERRAETEERERRRTQPELIASHAAPYGAQATETAANQGLFVHSNDAVHMSMQQPPAGGEQFQQQHIQLEPRAPHLVPRNLTGPLRETSTSTARTRADAQSRQQERMAALSHGQTTYTSNIASKWNTVTPRGLSVQGSIHGQRMAPPLEPAPYETGVAPPPANGHAGPGHGTGGLDSGPSTGQLPIGEDTEQSAWEYVREMDTQVYQLRRENDKLHRDMTQQLEDERGDRLREHGVLESRVRDLEQELADAHQARDEDVSALEERILAAQEETNHQNRVWQEKYDLLQHNLDAAVDRVRRLHRDAVEEAQMWRDKYHSLQESTDAMVTAEQAAAVEKWQKRSKESEARCIALVTELRRKEERVNALTKEVGSLQEQLNMTQSEAVRAETDAALSEKRARAREASAAAADQGLFNATTAIPSATATTT